MSGCGYCTNARKALGRALKASASFDLREAVAQGRVVKQNLAAKAVSEADRVRTMLGRR